MKIYTPFFQNKQGYYTFFNNNPINNSKLSFCAQPLSDKLELRPPYERALGKLQNITRKEYDSLTDAEKSALRAKIDKLHYKKQFLKDVKMHQFAAESIRQAFDNEFGKEKYVVVPIGRSISSISRLLAMKIGEENVKNIPMSSMHQYYISAVNFQAYLDNIERFENQKGFKEVKKYLESVGLGKNDLKNSSKTYIIMDYVCSGMSLEGAYTVLSSDSLCGNEKRNVIFASLNDVAYLTGKEEEIRKLDDDLLTGSYKKYSFVRKTNQNLSGYKNSANPQLFWQEKPKTAEFEKLFGFALMDDEFNNPKKPYIHLVFKPYENKIPAQKKHIWINSFEQLLTDIKTDILQIYNFMKRLDVPRSEFFDYRYKLRLLAGKTGDKIKKSADGLFLEKFPDEFMYYKNRKEFEEQKFFKSKAITEYYGRIICAETPDFGANSKLYKFFDDTYKKIDAFVDKFQISGADYEKMNKFYHELAEYEIDLNLSRITGTKELQNSYYTDIQPCLHKLFDNISKDFSQERCKELAEFPKNAYNNCAAQLENYQNEFLNDLKADLQEFSPGCDPEKLKKLVQAQKSALLALEA